MPALRVREASDPNGEIPMNGTLFALHGYWTRKRGERSMPSRKDIDPIEIASLLPNIVLLEIKEGRLRYRLVGSAMVELLGTDPTGKYLEEFLSPQRYEVAAQTYGLVLKGRRSLMSRGKFIGPSGSIAMITRLVLPLSDNDFQPNMILVGMIVERGPTILKEILGPKTQVDPDVEIKFL